MQSTFRAAFYAFAVLGVVSSSLYACATGGGSDPPLVKTVDAGKADGAEGGITTGCGTKNQQCCTGNAQECNTGLFCNMGTCKVQEPTDFGKACAFPSDCMSGICAPLDLDGGGANPTSTTVCSTTCLSTETTTCPEGWSCPPPQAVGQMSVCICTPVPETCDGKDDNCDGKIDEEPAADEWCTAQNENAPSKCINGMCQCNTMCSGNCTDLTSDPANCGECGKTCAAPETCASSKCTCPAGDMCGSKCVDVTSDPANCGGCGKTCAYTCANSECSPNVLASGASLGIAGDGTNAYFFVANPTTGALALEVCAAAGCMSMPTTLAMGIVPTAAGGGGGFGGSTAGDLLVVGGTTDLYWPDGTNVQGEPLPLPTPPPAGPKPFFAGPGTSAPWQVATDATSVYWADSQQGYIFKCPIGPTCTNPTVLVNFTGVPLPTDAGAPEGGSPEAGSDGGSLDGGSLDSSADAGFALPFPENIAVDTKYIYWTDTNGSISSRLLAGGPTNLIVDGTVSQIPPNGIVAANGNVYWTATNFFGFGGSGVYTCPAAPTSGQCPDPGDGVTNPGNTFSPATTVAAAGIATDGTDLYWTDDGPPGAVYKCALGTTCASATTVVTLGSGAAPGLIAVDTKHTYWIDSTSGSVFVFSK